MSENSPASYSTQMMGSAGEAIEQYQTTRTALEALHAHLLQLTKRWVTDIPFYQRHWKDVLSLELNFENLRRFPIVDKELYEREYEHEFHPAQNPIQASFSSGTTGQPTFRYHSQSELSFARTFFPLISSERPTRAEQLPLILSLETGYHGSRVAAPVDAFILKGAVHDDILLDQTIGHLCRNHSIPRTTGRVSDIVGSVSLFKILTSSLLERGIAVPSLGVKTLYSTGEYISSRWKTFLETTWDARLVDRYSVSEIYGGMTKCEICGFFHPDPHLIVECLDVDTKQPLTEGIGVLTLTELYPFVQLQPLIRYWTDDLARVNQVDCARSSSGYELLGRRRYSIQIREAARTDFIVLPAHLYELLDAESLVAKEAIFPQLSRVYENRLGHPLATSSLLENGPQSVLQIYVTPNASHWLYSGEFTEMAARLRERLLAANSELDKRVRQRRLSIEICFTNRLNSAYEVESALADVRLR